MATTDQQHGTESDLVHVLKARVAELESQIAKDAAVVQRATADHEKLVTQLLTARSNNDILSGNIETLKGLATQLATKLEDATAEIATLKDSVAVADLKIRRDAAQEVVAAQSDCDRRVELMRLELQDVVQEMKALRDASIDGDVKAEIMAAKVAAGKDAIIAELRSEIQTLKAQVEYMKQRAAADAEAESSAKKYPARSRTRAAAAAPTTLTAPPSLWRSSSTALSSAGSDAGRDAALAAAASNKPWQPRRTAWDSESEVTAANRAVVDVRVCIDKRDFDAARFRRGGTTFTSTGPARYLVDVVADSGFVDEVPFTPAKGTTNSFVSPNVSIIDGAVVERCAFLAATGDEIRVTVEVLPLASF